MADLEVEIETTKSAPAWLRIDAVAVSAGGATLLVAACLLSYPPLFGGTNFIGPGAVQIARPLADSLGWGLLPLVCGLFHLLAMYTLRRGLTNYTLRATGWACLALAVAGLADAWQGLARDSLPVVSAFGRGGAIGAWLTLQLQSFAQAPFPKFILLALATLGLAAIADQPFRFFINAGFILTNRLAETLLSLRLPKRKHVETAAEAVTPQGSFSISTPTPPPIQRPLRAINPYIAAAEAKAIAAQVAAREHQDDTPLELHRPMLIIHRPQTVASTTASNDTPPMRFSPTDDVQGYIAPGLELLRDQPPHPVEDHEQRLRERAALLEKTFADFGLNIKVVGIHTGPVITQYEVALDTGLRLSKVTVLADDLALCLGVQAVRIVAPLPGRNTVGIEVPNDYRQMVRLKELILATSHEAQKFKLPIFLGKDVEGRPLAYDLATMPHLLIAGRTGTGKSVCLNTIILSLLYTRTPDECRLIMIDPKKVELSEYGKVPHLMHPVITDDKKAEAVLAWAVDKMEERYELLRKARVRNIASFNELSRDEILRRIDPPNEEERAAVPSDMPYIVIIVDEVGDLIMSMKKEVESHIIRLAQKSRAAGIHLILATQKPTVDVVTGLIKSNLPARICFQVASRADSAVVLDEKGAEKLLGMGDMLFLQPGTSTIIRAQGAYVDDGEIGATVEALEVYEPNFESELLNLKAKDEAGTGSLGEKLRERDPLYEQAVEIVIREQRGSTSLLQRAMGIGYGKASRFIDFMHEDGIVGGYNGSNARDVLISPEEWAMRRNEV